MKILRHKKISTAVFLLLYYIYLDSVRKFAIPYALATIPLLLAVVSVLLLTSAHGKLSLPGRSDEKALCLSWIAICIYITFNNADFVTALLDGGIIQLFVMVVFLLFSRTRKKDEWINLWINLTIAFTVIHALATIVFYFNYELYSGFVHATFDTATALDCLKYYKRGAMSGLSTHFSTNGMILAIGLMMLIEKTLYYASLKKSGRNNKKIALYAVITLFVAYALILSSKRMPLIASVAAVVVTYIISKRKNIFKRILIILSVALIVVFLYNSLVDHIPGLSTIADKFQSLEESDTGSLNGRESLWEIAIDMFKENPVFGSGYGSYHIRAKALDAITTNAHNHYLQILSELGLTGLLLYLIAFLSGLTSTFKKLCKASLYNQKQNNIALKISFEVQVFVLLYCITASALMYYTILIPYFIALAASKSIKVNKKRYIVDL